MNEWMDFAACRGVNPDLFFPERWDGHGEESAKAVCAVCPVCRPCLEYALANKCFNNQGVLGGTTVNERTRIRRQRRRAAERARKAAA